MLKRVLHSKTKTTTSAAFLLGISSLISGVLGLIRDRLLAGHYGASVELDIYFAAFRIPDFVYGLLIIGGLSVSFLPIFSEYFTKKDKESPTHESRWQRHRGSSDGIENPRQSRDSTEPGWPEEASEFTNNLLNCFLFLLILLCAVLAIFTPFIINIITPGFSLENKAIAVQLTRILFLSPIFFGMSSIFSGILQYFDRFLIYALAPVLYNLGIIFGIIFLLPVFGIKGVVYGVILGAAIHLLIQIPSAKISGFKYRFILDFKHRSIAKVFKIMGPRLLGIMADQLNITIIIIYASTLAAGSIAILNFSNNIQYFPVGIIGVSFAVASFPVFSRHLANGQKKEFSEKFSSSFRQVIFFIFPVVFLLFLLRIQIVRLILGTGQFGWWETRLTAAVLGIFCLSVLARSLLPLIVRAFFAFQDTKTPAIVGMISLVFNVFFIYLFIYLLKTGGVFYNFLSSLLKLQDVKNIEIIALPLAVSFTLGIQFVLLLIFLYKKFGDLKLREILVSLKNVLTASLIMAGFVYLISKSLAYLVNMQTFWGIFEQTAISALVGVIVYVLFSHFLGSRELKTLKLAVFQKRKNEQSFFNKNGI